MWLVHLFSSKRIILLDLRAQGPAVFLIKVCTKLLSLKMVLNSEHTLQVRKYAILVQSQTKTSVSGKSKQVIWEHKGILDK